MNLAFALAILTSPADNFQIDPAVAKDVVCRRHLAEIALQLELLDPRETRYVFVRDEDINTDCRLVQRRYAELKDAPKLDEGCVFPDRDCLNDLLKFNRDCRSWVEDRVKIDLVRWWELRQTIQDLDQCYQRLDLIRDAKCDYYYVTVRRGALLKLIERYGPLHQISLDPVPPGYFRETP